MIMKLLLLALALQAAPEQPVLSSQIDAALAGGGSCLPFEWKLVEDAEFLRRLTRDLTGRDPSGEELKAFAADPAPGKRGRKIDELLDSDAFAAFWAGRWTGVLLGDSRDLTVNLSAAARKDLNERFTGWLEREIRKDRPYPGIVQDLIAAEGSSAPRAVLAYKVSFLRRPSFSEEFAAGVARHFLGLRLQCARCHDHPFDQWTTEHFYGLAAFAARHTARLSGDAVEVREEASGEQKFPVAGLERKESRVRLAAEGDRIARPVFLFGGEAGEDRKRSAALARFMTVPGNTQLPRAYVNRVWGWLFGRAIVEPPDDFIDVNRRRSPNTPLLELLTRSFTQMGHSQKSFLRALLNTQAYQLVDQSKPLPDGVAIWRGTTKLRPAAGRLPKPPPDRISYELPAAWTEVPLALSDGRLHQYRVPDKEGKARPAELALFRVASVDVKSRLEGWSRQMGAARQKEEGLEGNHPVAVYELSGVYSCVGAGDPPTRDRMLVGAVVVDRTAWVFRLLGPEETVDDWRAEFVDLLKRAR